MRQIEINDAVLLAHLAGLSPDAMESFILFNSKSHREIDEERDDAVRGAVINSSRLVNEMRSAHELGILETLILGQAYTGSLLMTRSLKGTGRLTLDIGCAGPVQGLSVEANAAGEVRGYLKQSPIPVTSPLESFDTAPYFGPGIMTVSRYPDSSTQAFTGNIDLQFGNIGQDIANYYLISEQTRTSVAVSIKFDTHGRVIGAGGLFIEALPGASDAFLADLQNRVTAMDSLGERFSRGETTRQVAESISDSSTLRPLEIRPAQFYCGCSRERFSSFIASMKQAELKEIVEEGPFPLVTICHNCNSRYEFSRNELQIMADRS